MARLLYRLGRWAAAHPGRVVLAWALLLVLAAVLGAGLHGQLSSVFTVPGTESQNAQNLLQQKFPAAAGGTAQVVFAVVVAFAVLAVALSSLIAAGLPLLTALIGEAIGVLGVEFVLAKLAAASGDLAQGRPEPDPALGRTTRAHRAERSAASRG